MSRGVKRKSVLKNENNLGRNVIVVLVFILFALSLIIAGISYNNFVKPNSKDRTVYSPSVSSKTINGLTYKMTENYLTVSNFNNAENLQSGEENGVNNIEMFLDFNCYHCKRLFLGNINKIEELLKQEEPISVSFVFVNFFGAKSTTNWSENSASIMALIAELYPNNFIQAAKMFFVAQPDSVKEAPVSMDESVAYITEKLNFSFPAADVVKLNDNFYLNWVNDIVNKYAVQKDVSALPVVLYNGSRLNDPAVEFPKILNSLIVEDESKV